MTLLTARQAAEVLQTSESWIYEHAAGRPNVKLPAIPCVRMGRVVRFERAALEQFIVQNQAVARPQAVRRSA